MASILSTLLYVLLAVVILSVIVMAHEFGHYAVGRLTGIGVVEFSVGMGPKLFGWTRKGIKYSLRAIPLGGYCRFVGEDEDCKDPSAMNNQPVWKRMLTVAAGPAMNFALALIAAGILLMVGALPDESSYRVRTIIGQVSTGSPAEAAGILAGDRIVEANGEAIFDDEAGVERMRAIIGAAQDGETVSLMVAREGQDAPVAIALKPAYNEQEKRMMIGVVFVAGYARALEYNVFQAIPESFKLNVKTTGDMIDALKGLIGKLFGVKSAQTDADTGDISGVVGIVSSMTTTVRDNFDYSVFDGMSTIVKWLWLLSLNLGIMNLLPVPALDGGRLVFLVIEGIRRKPIDREKEGLTHLIGLALLLVLICVVTWKDIARMIG